MVKSKVTKVIGRKSINVRALSATPVLKREERGEREDEEEEEGDEEQPQQQPQKIKAARLRENQKLH